jgi:beta-galactosidase
MPACLLLAGGSVVTACVPRAEPSRLEPTLSMERDPGGPIAVQNGIAVPTFEFQPRPRIDLDGSWRVTRLELDDDLSLTPRSGSLETIVAQAAGREAPGYDDRGWDTIRVPGTVNPPPRARETGAWYRRLFTVPAAWTGRAVTLKFGAANYVADVWLNGVWLGYHEGGYTPFAFEATGALRPGSSNLVAVRVDNPAWGSRTDIVPWGLADWWNAGGLTRSVWLEASDTVRIARADVSPHLDGADVSIVLENRDQVPATVLPVLELLSAQVTQANLLDRDARALIASTQPLAVRLLDQVEVPAGARLRVTAEFVVADADLWSPESPALYVLRARIIGPGGLRDEIDESFGLRQVRVDPAFAAVRLNDRAVAYAGVAIHDERVSPDPAGAQAETAPGTAAGRPAGLVGVLPDAAAVRDQLLRARAIGAQLIRTAHTPASPDLLRLSDRLGFAIWEEIPLYHFTPFTFTTAMRRGIAQQMLQEMALRDMNRPSVLFHGLANESTGDAERIAALDELARIDREIDGTRLTGQAEYAFATDTTSQHLDVAGFTFYYGVLYDGDPAADTARALEAAHRAYPGKPILALEYGRWADTAADALAQAQIASVTGRQFVDRRVTSLDGFVGAAVWWTLEDYYTMRPGIELEQFGLYAPNGSPRPAAAVVHDTLRPMSAPPGQAPAAASTGRSLPAPDRDMGLLFLGYLAYAAAVTLGLLGVVLAAMLARGGRSGWHWPARRVLRR